MSSSSISYKQLNISAQAVFWVSYLSLLLFTFSTVLTFQVALLRGITMLVFSMVLAYIHVYYLLPRYFEQQRFGLHVAWLLILIGGITLCRLAADYGLGSYFAGRETNSNSFLSQGLQQPEILKEFITQEYQNSENELDFLRRITLFFFVKRVEAFLYSPAHVVTVLIHNLLIILLTIPLYMMETWHQRREEAQQLQSKSLEAELKFLKLQLSPHFLFNTLNNLYSLAFTQSEKTASSIMKLSEMMRYMIYECNVPEVSLRREIQYLENYIELQQLKTERPQNIYFKISGDPANKSIPPLLFVPLLENAFKHGIPEKLGLGWIEIKLNIDLENIYFSVRNNYNTKARKDDIGGIGLENIQHRLKLTYPSKHDFRVGNNEGVFEVVVDLKAKKQE